MRAPSGLFLSSATPGIERISPSEAGEAGEVRIRRVESAIVLHRQRCQLGIGREIAGRSDGAQKAGEEAGVPMCGLHDADVRLRKPLLNTLERVFNRPGVHEHNAVGGQPNETEQDCPCQGNWLRAGKRCVPPLARGGVPGRIQVVGMEAG